MKNGHSWFATDVRIGSKTVLTPLEIGCLFYARKQTSISYAVDCDVIVCYGAAKIRDKHLAATLHMALR
jgi:hypothetical protein